MAPNENNYFNKIYGSDNEEESSSSDDSSDEEEMYSDNELTLMSIKLCKLIMNKYPRARTSKLLRLFDYEISDMKRYYNKIYNKDSLFIKKLKLEIKYYENFVKHLEDYYKEIGNYDMIQYLNNLEVSNKINSSSGSVPLNMCFTILLNNEKATYDDNNLNNDDDDLNKQFFTLYNSDSTSNSSYDYFKKLDLKQKKQIIEQLSLVKNDEECDIKPNMIKVLEWDTSSYNKSIILSKLNQFENLQGNSEYYKLKTWINKLIKIPFGKIINPPVTKHSGQEEIKNYLNNVRTDFDKNIYGHDMTKDQLIKIIAQTITNPEEGGNIFALEGPPGVGKTAIIHDGISKALNRPFAFISLGGATDASYLEGFDYTYEGSNHGKIIDVLMQTKCMNPILYFDELDKVSDTPKGEEIINILMHLTDTTQNFCFNDKYFGGINFDLSKVIMIFSFNDASKISRILRDRMKIIKVKGYKLQDKVVITRDYVLPKLIKSVGLEDDRVTFHKEIIEFIIDNYTNEGGVRKLKEVLNDILLEINLRKLQGRKIKNDDSILITEELVENDILKKKRKIEILSIDNSPKIGVVNGLWANSLGVGGLIPIECSWVPAAKKLDLELTGMQGTVMKESMLVAKTIAWKIIPKKVKTLINKRWKTSFEFGIHIHCPDGATPKDGPSAGGAITTCLISLLTGIPVNNKIAMTGEINLKGNITAIGGLEEKLFGAKKAGAELVLCPKQNSKDLHEVKDKYPSLINDNFRVEIVDNIWEVLDKVLVDHKFTFVKF
jgi:endopeptidase La